MQKPIVSVIASAIKTQYWAEFYAMLCAKNSIPFEIVFVGDVRPNFNLPENFIYIYNEASPIQCYETACRNAKGEFVWTLPDDLIIQPGTLDILYQYIKRLWNEKAILSPRYSGSTDSPAMDNLFCFDIDYRFPPIVVNMFMRKKVWQELGGFDKRFITLYAELDLQLRAWWDGGHPFIIPGEQYVIKERNQTTHRLTDSVLHLVESRGFLDSLWKNSDGSYSRNRLEAVQPFTDDEIPIIR